LLNDFITFECLDAALWVIDSDHASQKPFLRQGKGSSNVPQH
jgi:hypothetical protein